MNPWAGGVNPGTSMKMGPTLTCLSAGRRARTSARRNERNLGNTFDPVRAGRFFRHFPGVHTPGYSRDSPPGKDSRTNASAGARATQTIKRMWLESLRHWNAPWGYFRESRSWLFEPPKKDKNMRFVVRPIARMPVRPKGRTTNEDSGVACCSEIGPGRRRRGLSDRFGWLA